GKESWIKHNVNNSTEISLFLEEYLNTRVLVDINVRVYTVFEKCENRTFSHDDFMLITIRSGSGSGIFLNGNLYYGHQEHAGEIGHMTVNKNGIKCVCGREGCLQTEVNQNRLYKQYLQKVLLQKDVAHDDPPQEELLQNLPKLFSQAKNGDKAAAKIIQKTVGYLGKSIAHTLIILNIPHIIISGHFGTDGDVILKPLEEEIRKRILSRMDFSLSYLPLENKGFTVGAALLIFKDYFTDIPI
nr:ROK family protein [Candidatus Brocadiales bacterium]